jgi:hypothetical protein
MNMLTKTALHKTVANFFLIICTPTSRFFFVMGSSQIEPPKNSA